MADKKKILVLESEKLLPASITSLLTSQSELDVMETTIGTLESWNRANGPRPDIVILEEGLLAANISDVVKLADRHPNLKLVVFGLGDEKIQIFEKQTVQVRHISDLLRVL